jgi:hypothetical protein
MVQFVVLNEFYCGQTGAFALLESTIGVLLLTSSPEPEMTSKVASLPIPPRLISVALK